MRLFGLSLILNANRAPKNAPAELERAGNLGPKSESGLERFERRIGEALNDEGHQVIVAGDKNVRKVLEISENLPAAEHIAQTKSGGYVIAEGKKAGRADLIDHATDQLKTTAEYLRKKIPGAKIESLEITIASEAELEGYKVVGNQLHKITPNGSELVKINDIPVTVKRVSRK